MYNADAEQSPLPQISWRHTVRAAYMIFYCNDTPDKEIEKNVEVDKLKQKEF